MGRPVRGRPVCPCLPAGRSPMKQDKLIFIAPYIVLQALQTSASTPTSSSMNSFAAWPHRRETRAETNTAVEVARAAEVAGDIVQERIATGIEQRGVRYPLANLGTRLCALRGAMTSFGEIDAIGVKESRWRCEGYGLAVCSSAGNSLLSSS